MPTLTLPKTYADSTVLFKLDIDSMWDELEELVNGKIDSDNVDPAFASWAVVRLDKDTTFTVTKAGSIETNVISDTQVMSIGNVVKEQVTVPKSQVESVNNEAQHSLDKQIKDMDDANTKKLDSLSKATNGF